MYSAGERVFFCSGVEGLLGSRHAPFNMVVMHGGSALACKLECFGELPPHAGRIQPEQGGCKGGHAPVLQLLLIPAQAQGLGYGGQKGCGSSVGKENPLGLW